MRVTINPLLGGRRHFVAKHLFRKLNVDALRSRLRKYAAEHQIVETPREGSRIGWQLSVENIGLIEQQVCQILHILCATIFLRPCQMSDEGVLQVEFEDGFGAAAAILAGEQTLQLSIPALRTGYQAGRTFGKTRRRLHVDNPIAQRAFHSLQHGSVVTTLDLVAVWFLSGVEQRDQPKINVTLAQRL